MHDPDVQRARRQWRHRTDVAHIKGGASCITPCELTVTPMGPFIVEFLLNGYEPQSTQVVLPGFEPEGPLCRHSA